MQIAQAAAASAATTAGAITLNQAIATLALGTGVALGILTSSTDFTEERKEPVLFGQKRAGPFFTDNEDIPEHQRGRSLDAVAADLTSGVLSSSDICILVFRDPRSGQLVSANTRGLTVLSMAGLKPTNVVEIIPSQNILDRLTQTSVLGDRLPSPRIAITPSKTDLRILKTVHIAE